MDMQQKSYDTYIVITPNDFQRLKSQYARLVQMIPMGKLIFVGNDEVGTLVDYQNMGERVSFLNEDSLLAFSEVRSVLNRHMCESLGGGEVIRGVVGWYYQQFLKYEIARNCGNEYYMTWDGDTIPCRSVIMFSDDGSPYLDNKNEYHELYFTTMKKLLPGLRKMIRSSFISEHMLFNSEIVKELLNDIEKNEKLHGDQYWEKILLSIEPSDMYQSAFSEFETYGSYVAQNHPELYRIREWHSFRLGGEFFDINTISDRDYEWLGKDFDAISFEKGHVVREDNSNLFDNPYYQSKLSAKQMLLAAQEVFKGGYIEKWDGQAGGDPLS